MMEKAILDAAEKNRKFRQVIVEPSRFTALHDSTFQELLEKQTPFAKGIAKAIAENKLYKAALREPLRVKKFQRIAGQFLDHVREDTDDAAHVLTMKLNARLGLAKYELICDIIKSRVPREINIDLIRNDEPVELASKSRIVRSLQEEITLKVYSRSDRLLKGLTTNQLKQSIMHILTSWSKS